MKKWKILLIHLAYNRKVLGFLRFIQFILSASFGILAFFAMFGKLGIIEYFIYELYWITFILYQMCITIRIYYGKEVAFEKKLWVLFGTNGSLICGVLFSVLHPLGVWVLKSVGLSDEKQMILLLVILFIIYILSDVVVKKVTKHFKKKLETHQGDAEYTIK